MIADAAIKIDTFNFTRYGLLHGKVLTVSHDAITRDKPQDKSVDKPQGAEASSSEPKVAVRRPSPAVKPPTSTSCVRTRAVLIHPGERLPGSYRPARRFAAPRGTSRRRWPRSSRHPRRW